ncbi:MAG: DNA-processing protein DprA [Nitrospira sp.]|nr:DNA-processing protein DprA [Nitrospira sp.]
MGTSANTQAVLLLTTHFPKSQRGAAMPLTPREWGQFSEWLQSRSLMPESLLREDLNVVLQGWQNRDGFLERIKRLLERGAALSLSMDKWLRSGLWAMTCFDSDYPVRLKHHLGGDAPAVLFGCGRRDLLSGGGLAVVGSRDACERDLDYSRKLGALVSQSGRSVISGGARGVDESAMLGALEDEGTAVGVMADNLLRACLSVKYRRYLMDNNLTLLSPFNPEAGFNVGNAMQRNKYIYCLADMALVVHTGRKGGTWNGAMENLARNWVPLWVKTTDDREAGNSDLIGRGATVAPADLNHLDVERLFESCRGSRAVDTDLLSHASTVTGKPMASHSRNARVNHVTDVDKAVANEVMASGKDTPGTRPDEQVISDGQRQHMPSSDGSQLSFYQFFLGQIQRKCSNEPQTSDYLLKEFQITKSQLHEWLKRAVSEGLIKKIPKPVRYQWTGQKRIFQ